MRTETLRSARRSWSWLLVGAVLVVAGTPMVALLPAAAASTCGTFEAVAAADGFRTAAESPGFVLVERAEAGSPAAQTVLDSVGTSVGHAAYPYPGDSTLSLLPLVGIPQETYPLVAASSYPTHPDAEVDAGGIALAAHSKDRSSSAEARGGAADGDTTTALTRAKADVSCSDDGSVTAVAESTAEGLGFGAGVLRIGRIHSIAKVVVGADGQPRVESSLNAGQIAVAGQTVGLSDRGLILGDSSTPLPGNPLAEALKGAGIEVEYVASRRQPDGGGVTAPGVRIRVAREAVGTGATAVTYTFGRAFAAAMRVPAAAENDDAQSTSGDAEGISDDASPESVGGTLGAPVSPSTAGVPPPTSAGAVAQDVAASVVPPNQDGTGIAGRRLYEDGEETGQARRGEAALGTPRPLGAVVAFSAWSFYVVLVAAAAAMFLGAMLLRMLGVKLAWT